MTRNVKALEVPVLLQRLHHVHAPAAVRVKSQYSEVIRQLTADEMKDWQQVDWLIEDINDQLERHNESPQREG